MSYLDVDWGEGDYWSDVGIIEAGELMAGFNDSEWQRLRNLCQSESVVWQTRCAQTLDGETHPAALELLMSSMGSDSCEVVIAAADTLLSLAQAGTRVE